MMSFSTNMPAVLNNVYAQITALDIDRMTRLQATSLLAIMRNRIHVEGKDSQNTPIGTYTPAYIMNTRVKAGRGTDNKVILSLTRSMENSMELYPIPNGTGIGFSTQENWQKARWCEETYQKPIYNPTPEEKAMVKEIGEDYVKKHLGNG